MTDRELLELIAAQVGNLSNQVDTLTNHVDTLTNQVGSLANKVGNIEAELEHLNQKVDKNHAETIARLSRLEENQTAIKQFILNSDDTFRKSEEAYNVIQKFKEALSK